MGTRLFAASTLSPAHRETPEERALVAAHAATLDEDAPSPLPLADDEFEPDDENHEPNDNHEPDNDAIGDDLETIAHTPHDACHDCDGVSAGVAAMLHHELQRVRDELARAVHFECIVTRLQASVRAGNIVVARGWLLEVRGDRFMARNAMNDDHLFASFCFLTIHCLDWYAIPTRRLTSSASRGGGGAR